MTDERDLMRDALKRSMGEAGFGEVRERFEKRIETGSLIEVEGKSPARAFTTEKMIQYERDNVSEMRKGQGQHGVLVNSETWQSVQQNHTHLSASQRTAVEQTLATQDKIVGLEGVAGAGKTTTLTVIRSAAESHGYQVEGFAPTSRAARHLGEAGVQAGTLQGFLARSATPDLPEQKHFYLVDESSLASTNQIREFLSRLGPDDRVLLIGDIRQHQGVEAGRPFEQLQEAGMHTAKLDEIVRQQDPALKSAVELMASGQVSAALDALQQQGRIKEIPNAEERVRAVAKCYVESPENTLIVSPDNASRRQLNVAVREELKAIGTVAPEDHTFRVLVQRQDMTGAERSWASHYEIDDVVRYTHGSKAIGIQAAAYASVVAINPAANQLTVEKANKELATYDPRRLTGVSVYREIEREFSVGDRVQFTAPDKSLGVANRDLAVIQSIAPDGQVAARLDNNRHIEFNAGDHRHFDHGYAVTSHSSQGLTADRVLVHADMWCDDAPQSQLSAETFGGRRAWTQMILLSLTEAGILQPDEYTKAVAKMIGMGFTTIFFDAKCVLESAKLAEFRTSRFPLKQMLEVFQNVSSTPPVLVRQFLEFFVVLQGEPILPPQKALIVRAFLDSLWRNAATHGMVLSLRSMSARLFGLNVIAETEFNAFFDSWFGSLNRPIV